MGYHPIEVRSSSIEGKAFDHRGCSLTAAPDITTILFISLTYLRVCGDVLADLATHHPLLRSLFVLVLLRWCQNRWYYC